jgi:hypothetical protein
MNEYIDRNEFSNNFLDKRLFENKTITLNSKTSFKCN